MICNNFVIGYIQGYVLMIYQSFAWDKKSRTSPFCFFGAGSRGRTDTVLLPSDFESDASANSTIPAYGSDFRQRKVLYHILFKKSIRFDKNNRGTDKIISILKFLRELSVLALWQRCKNAYSSCINFKYIL